MSGLGLKKIKKAEGGGGGEVVLKEILSSKPLEIYESAPSSGSPNNDNST